MQMIQNIDTLDFSVLVADFDVYMQAFRKPLKEAKLQSIDSSKNTVVLLAGMSWEVYPYSNRRYVYILHNEMVELRLCDSWQDTDSHYPIFVRLKSYGLWRYGYQQAFKKFMAYLNKLFKVVDTKISRLDIATQVNKKIEIDIDIGAETVSRTKFRHQWFSDGVCTGYQFGKGDVLLRIYDKVKEIEVSRKFWFADVWDAENFIIERGVWNVEFQLRRDFLREWDIDTVEEAFSELENLYSYLTRKWFRVVAKQEKDTNVTRRDTCDWWQVLQEKHDGIDKKPKKENKKVKPSTDHLIACITGYLISIGAVDDLDINDLMIKVKDGLVKNLEKKETTYQLAKEERRSLYVKI
ncbi:MAG: hypothetical protein E6276_04170 [Clostridiales bacterium]|nr:hypothetical protein [Clostridiales bacterium]